MSIRRQVRVSDSAVKFSLRIAILIAEFASILSDVFR
jgi:hypothetical protein